MKTMLGKKILELLEMTSSSQYEFCRQTEINPAYLSRIINGKSKISEKIAKETINYFKNWGLYIDEDDFMARFYASNGLIYLDKHVDEEKAYIISKLTVMELSESDLEKIKEIAFRKI